MIGKTRDPGDLGEQASGEDGAQARQRPQPGGFREGPEGLRDLGIQRPDLLGEGVEERPRGGQAGVERPHQRVRHRVGVLNGHAHGLGRLRIGQVPTAPGVEVGDELLRRPVQQVVERVRRRVEAAVGRGEGVDDDGVLAQAGAFAEHEAEAAVLLLDAQVHQPFPIARELPEGEIAGRDRLLDGQLPAAQIPRDGERVQGIRVAPGGRPYGARRCAG